MTNSSNIERRLSPRPNTPSSVTFPSFYHLVNNKKCSYSRYHSCLPSTNRRHLCSTLRPPLVIVHVSAGQSHFWRQWINTELTYHLLCHAHVQISFPQKNCHIKIARVDAALSERPFSYQYSKEMNFKSRERSKEWLERLSEVFFSALNREETRLTGKNLLMQLKKK